MFNIHFLPADHGDCIWIEYGNGQETHRVLIDAGTQHSFAHLEKKIRDLTEDPLNFELFVITHVDADHIGGSLELLRKIKRLGKKIVFRDIWFNGWKHLVPEDLQGDLQGELVTNHLERRKLPWNSDFEKGAVIVPPDGDLPVRILPGGMRLTLFSPSREKLDLLHDRWEETILEAKLKLGGVKDKEEFFEGEEAGDALGDEMPDVNALADADFKGGDRTVANGSSIAFLAEYDDGETPKSCFFTGDAHADMLIESIVRLDAKDHRIKDLRLRTDLLKVSHHGSKNNISNDLLNRLDCSNFLFSTNGQQFKHPNPEGVARVIKYGRPSNGDDPKLYFNYRSIYNEIWDDDDLRKQYDYRTEYPPKGKEGIVIEL